MFGRIDVRNFDRTGTQCIHFHEGMKAQVNPVQSFEPYRILAPTQI